jgi:hypothetical protein
MTQIEIEDVPNLTDDRLRVIWDCSIKLARNVGSHGHPHRAKFYAERAKACEDEAAKRGLELANR